MKTKLFIATLFFGLLTLTVNAQEAEPEKEYEIGASLKYWMPGEIYIAGPGSLDKEGGIFLNAYADYNIVRKFAIGAYFNYGPSIKVEESSDGDASFFESGMQLKVKIFAGNIKICPALQIGYRTLKVEDYDALKGQGLAVNLNADVVIPTKGKISLVPSIGFLSQPVGGNDIGNVDWVPIMFIGFGIAF